MSTMTKSFPIFCVMDLETIKASLEKEGIMEGIIDCDLNIISLTCNISYVLDTLYNHPIFHIRKSSITLQDF